jgi:hypothetical protein
VPPDPKTEELRIEQAQAERAERSAAEDADQSAEERAHARRADKHAYLRERLDERARSEDDG